MSPLNLARLGPLLAALLLAACGGGSGTSDPAAPVARVEILSASAWLAGAGQTRELAARAFDADGNPVNAAITWSSSRPAAVAVDANGRLTAAVAAGSAQISAQAGGVSSAPLLAYVATPAAGVVVVDDANIVGQLVETEPAAPPSLANTYQVTLNGIAPPAVGTLLLGRGDKPLAGKVTAVTTAGAQSTATLRLVPLAELFADLEIEEIFDLSRAEVLIPADVQAQFNVARSGNTWSFTPKPVPASQRARALAVTGTQANNILPFRNCEKSSPTDFDSLTDLPIGFDPPSFSITLDPMLDYSYSRLGGLTRFIVSADSKVAISAALKAQAALSGGLKCSLQLFALRVPIGGPLSFFFGGFVPVGVGFEIEAAATLASFKVESKAEAGTKASLGWSCPSRSECTFVRSMDDSFAKIEPKYEAPTLDGNLTLKAALTVFGYFEAELGNPFLRSLRFKAFGGQIGGRVDGSFSTSAAQLRDLAVVSEYSIALQGSAEAGIGAGDILRLLGFESLTSLGLEFSVPLAKSPQAQSVQADRASFAAGDTVNVKVALDPATLTFLPNVYNVKSVQLLRRVGDTSEVLATQTASTGQQMFEFAVTAPAAGDVSEWSAFVVTRLLEDELLSLELGSPSPAGVAVQMTHAEIRAGSGCQALLHNGSIDARGEPEGSYVDGDGFVAVSGGCRTTLGAGSAGGAFNARISGPELARAAEPVDITVLSASGNFGASGMASVPANAETAAGSFRWVGYLDVFSGNGGLWELTVKGQPVTLIVTGSLDNALFSVQWLPSAGGVGESGVYSPNPPPGLLATGPIDHTVRLQPGQRVVVVARGAWVSEPRSPTVDGDPTTPEIPMSESVSGSGSWAFTLRFDP